MKNNVFAYVCAPYQGDRRNNEKLLRGYCRRLYKLGYVPIAPNLTFPQFLNDSKPEERQAAIHMAHAMLRRCRVLVLCGDILCGDMAAEIDIAKRRGMIITTLDGIEQARRMEQQEG